MLHNLEIAKGSDAHISSCLRGMQYVNIMDVHVSAVNMQTAISYLNKNMNEARGRYICAANVHTTVSAHENADYCKVQNESFLTLPDGKPLSILGRKRGFLEMDRVTGPDFMESILANTEHTDAKHYFYGNTRQNLDELLVYLHSHFPALHIAGCEPSLYRPLSSEEETDLCHRIKNSQADYVWIALGAPLQEMFCNKLSNKTNAVWIAVGGAFNVLAGVIPRAPDWMQKNCLEWLYRLMKEPRRLFIRYFVTNTKFLWYLAKEKVSGQ